MSATKTDVAFPVLTDSELACVAEIGVRRRFQDGDVLIEVEAKDYPFYVVRSGEVVIVESSTGVDKEVAVHRAGQFTGDVSILTGKAPYAEKVPDVDEGFTPADLKDPQKAQAIYKVIQGRLAKCRLDRPIGYLVREAPAEDVRALQQLAGHVREGGFITKFRKIFLRAEMNDDLEMVPARYGDAEDSSEYEELLPVSPP